MSVIKNKFEGADKGSSQGLSHSIYSFLASIRFTVLLLSMIAVGSIFGTVIKQGGSAEEYLSLYSENTYRLITLLGLDDAYHSLWFYGLIMLFVVNLSLCTMGRFSRFIKDSKRRPHLPDERTLLDMEMHFEMDFKAQDEMNYPAASHEVSKAGQNRENLLGTNSEVWTRGAIMRSLEGTYRCVYKETEGAVLEKGSLSRYGVFVIHASIILILTGGFAGTMLGYKGYMVLRKGESKDQALIRGAQEKAQPLGFALKCKDFKVTFYPGGEPKDYVSTVEVIDNGRVVLEKKIRVNDPLSYKGIHVYQASYGKTPTFLFNIDGENVTLKEQDTYSKGDLLLMVVRFENTVHNFGPGVLIAYLDNGEPKTSWFLRDVERLRGKQLQGVNIRLEEIKEDLYTGLEISRDPGVWIVWTGFAMILFGLYINFFMYHRKIYVRKGSKGIIVAGTALKGRDAFKQEFAKIKGNLNGMER
ncbi:MAG: hypothetical protein C0392_02065 [Syntrophus sp. (in: bacteria)]|nr:hypothetical protein [Syntrophus sp. (in: bacteria)]